MEYLILKSAAKGKLDLLAKLARELGIDVQFISSEEMEEKEDQVLGQAITEGLKTDKVSEIDIMKALGK
jgi:molybdenum cofactor biosynthesis enzyme MoaA